jgi:hypothetical protein
VKNPDACVETAFQTAIKMRLWEKGIPERLHAQFKEPFAATDASQDKRIIDKALAWVAAQSDMQTLKNETIKEVNEFFENSRLIGIGAKLNGVIAGMPTEQPLAIIPTDNRLAALVR